MANVGPSRWYYDFGDGATTGHYAVAAWVLNTSYAPGALVRQKTTPAVGSERVFVSAPLATDTASHTSSNTTEPTWVTTKGGQATDNVSIHWQECTGQPGVNGDTTNTPTWAQQHASSTVITLGLIIYDSGTSSLQICSTAGTIGGSAPAFSGTAGTVVADNTAKWTSLGAASNFGSWAAPHARLQAAIATNWFAAGHTLFAASESAETVSGTLTLTLPGTGLNPNLVVCVNKTNTPPTGSNVTTGASFTMTSSNSLTFAGSFYLQGMTISTASIASNMILGNANSTWQYYKNVSFTFTGGGSANILIGTGSSLNIAVTWDNTTVAFSAVGQGIAVSILGRFEWLNTPSAISGTMPTILFSFTNMQLVFLHGLDLSSAGSGKSLFDLTGTFAGKIILSNSKINASVSITSGAATASAWSLQLINVDSGATGYRNEYYDYFGTLTTEITITLSTAAGGASDGVQKYSWKIVTTANANALNPFIAPMIAYDNPATGSGLSLGVEIISSASLNNNDVWLETEALTSAGSPLGAITSDGLATPITTAAAQASSSASWDSSPATPVTQKLSNTVTPQIAGWIYGRLKVGKATTTLYANPVLT